MGLVGQSKHSSFFIVHILIRNAQGYNPTSGRLEASSTANQDPLLGHAVIIGVDLWEYVSPLSLFPLSRLTIR